MLVETGIKYLKAFYSNTTGDFASLNDIYLGYGLNLEKSEHNRKWLSNKQGPLKRLGLVTPKYKGKVLAGLMLTELGKSYLGRSGAGTPPPILLEETKPTNGHSTLTLEEIMKAMPKLREQNPEFEIMFNVRLKTE